MYLLYTGQTGDTLPSRTAVKATLAILVRDHNVDVAESSGLTFSLNGNPETAMRFWGYHCHEFRVLKELQTAALRRPDAAVPAGLLGMDLVSQVEQDLHNQRYLQMRKGLTRKKRLKFTEKAEDFLGQFPYDPYRIASAPLEELLGVATGLDWADYSSLLKRMDETIPKANRK